MLSFPKLGHIDFQVINNTTSPVSLTMIICSLYITINEMLYLVCKLNGFKSAVFVYQHRTRLLGHGEAGKCLFRA